MVSIPVIVLLLSALLTMSLVIFAYEYGRQMKELKSLKEEISILKLELSYERWNRQSGHKYEFETISGPYTKKKK